MTGYISYVKSTRALIKAKTLEIERFSKQKSNMFMYHLIIQHFIFILSKAKGTYQIKQS